jgi:ubiquitin carboxyl-terminal hydrolase 4/11/15
MNSILQCLAATESQVNYWIRDDYKKEINVQNVLGWKGKIAEAYGDLLKHIWSGKYTVISPRKLKQVLGEFAPRFSGFNQQDSSELLSFLLDGIHEDLNRVTTKPYIEAIEANDNDCESVAEKIWSNHKLRHDSIIVDNFQGLLKSRIVCPLCNHVSITFDPYMFLSIPLPTAQERIITFKMLYNNHDRPITEYGVRVTQAGSLSDLISAISEITRVQENRMIIGEIYTRKVFKFFNDKDLIGDIQTKDNIWVWEMPYQVDFENEFPLECRFFNNDGCYSANQIDFYLPITIPKDARRVDLFDLKSRFFAVASSWMIPYDSSDPAYHINAKSSQNQLTFYDLRYDNDTVDLSRANTLGIIFRKDLMNYERINAVSIDSSVPNETPGRSIQDEKILHLADCIDAYTMKETLSQENAWYCGKCKEFTCASKKFDIWSAPKILIFHLKRFLYSNLFRDKLGNFVEFPLEGLDMSNSIVGPH